MNLNEDGILVLMEENKKRKKLFLNNKKYLR
jgi:uncharacterized membrane protein YobD (UPF0266 family)